MDWEIFINVLITILFVGGFIIGGAKFIGEYSDANLNEEKRNIRNKFIFLFVIMIILAGITFSFINVYLIPTLNL